mgnify:CR=1 FL=1
MPPKYTSESRETAKLASNQLLQQASTSMVTQATNVSKHLLQILNKE